MLCADPVMGAGQPGLEIREGEMDDGQELFGHLGISAFGNGVVIITALAQAGVTAPIVRDDHCPRSDSAINKGLGQAYRLTVRGRLICGVADRPWSSRRWFDRTIFEFFDERTNSTAHWTSGGWFSNEAGQMDIS